MRGYVPQQNLSGKNKMHTINRSVAIIKPKQPFVDWIYSQSSPEDMISLEDVREDCMAVLMPQYDYDQEAIGYIEKLCTWIFETHLKEEFRKKKNWPIKRDYETFKKWFDVELHSIIFDSYEFDIEKETY